MRRAFLILWILILPGCSLFTSEDLHNDTEEDAMRSFLKGVYRGDSEQVSKLSLMEAVEDEELIAVADAENLGKARVHTCDFEETDSLQYDAVCQTDDAENVPMRFTLEENDKGYFVKEASIKPAVDFVFGQDAPELTREYVREIEAMIGDDLHVLDEDEKRDMTFQSHHVADAILQLYDGDAEEILTFFDLDVFRSPNGELTNERALVADLNHSLPDVSGELVTREILFGSLYDNLEGLGIDSEEDYEQMRNIFPHPLESSPRVEIQFVSDDGDDFYFSGEFYMDDGDLFIGAYSYDEQSTLDQATYDIKPKDTSKTVLMDEADTLYQTNCAACHASDFSGSVGPALTEAYKNFTEAEIADIIINGSGSMPPTGLAENEAEAISRWLMHQKTE